MRRRGDWRRGGGASALLQSPSLCRARLRPARPGHASLRPAAAAARAGAAPPPGPLLPEPDEWLDLWPGEAPGLPSPPPAEAVRERSTDPGYNDRAIFHVRRPRLAIFRPARPTGGAVLLTPGGSY